jgi:hypothetical protein
VRGKDVSCRSTASSDLKANAGVVLSSALSKMDGSLSAQLDHATSVEVNIAAWATDSLLEGPYEDRLFDLPLQNHFRRDATSEDRFVVVKALRVRGLTVTLGFTKEDSAKVKAQVAGLLKPIANVSVGLSGNWDSDNTLTLHANEDFLSLFAPLSSAQAMHEMFRHSKLFIISAYTAAPALLASSKTDATVHPIGLMFELYRAHFGTIPLEVIGNSPQHDVQGTVWVDKARVSSGSDTYPLDAVAMLTADRKALTVAIVNPTETEQQLDVAFKGVTLQTQGRLWRIAAPDLTADNEPGKPRVIDIVESPLTGVSGRLTLPKLSISLYELPIK